MIASELRPTSEARAAPLLRILLAEPSTYLSDLIGVSLRRIGIQKVIRVASSIEADRELALQFFDAAVISFALRPKDAVEFAVGLRRGRGRNAHIPIIAVANSVTVPRLSDAVRAGVSAVLRTPFSADDLKVRLMNALRSGAADEPYQQI